MSNVIDRPALFNIDAEKGVLASIIMNGEAIVEVLPFLSKQDFYREKHAFVYDILAKMHEEHKAIDFITITDELKKRGKLEEFGGYGAVGELELYVPTSIYIEHYARIVERDAKKRKLLAAAERIAKMVYDEGEASANELIERAEQEIFAIGQRHLSGTLVHIKDILGEFYQEAEKMFMDHQPDIYQLYRSGSPVGWLAKRRLNHDSRPPRDGQNQSGARNRAPGSPKGRDRRRIKSLEMGAHQLAQRLVSAETTIDIKRLRTGPIEEDDLVSIGFAIDHLSKGQMFIDQTAAISPLSMRAKSRRLATREPLDLVVIDYLQLMSARGKENRVQEISYISRSLKELARELNVPLIALSQLSRGVEQRQDKRPTLAGLRGSGSIEQDSDIVIFIYRDDFYNKDSETANLAEIIVAKHRNGPTGTVTLRFQKESAKFTNLNPYAFTEEELEKIDSEYDDW